MKRMDGKHQKGFTLSELLIVVAIIGVLVAVSIPIFTSQLAKARLATNQANIRAAKAAASADYMSIQSNGKKYLYCYDISTGSTRGNFPSNMDRITYLSEEKTNLDAKKYASLNETKNGVYQYVFILINDSGMTTNPYYDSSTKVIKTDSYK